MGKKLYKTQPDKIFSVNEPVVAYQTNVTVDKIYPNASVIKSQNTQSDWWYAITEAEKKSIEEGLKDLKEGKIISHSEVKKRYEKWIENKMDA